MVSEPTLAVSRTFGHTARELGQVAHGSIRAWHLGRGARNMDVAKRVDPGHLSRKGKPVWHSMRTSKRKSVQPDFSPKP